MRTTLFAALIALLGGCATSTVTAFKDPALSSQRYSRIGVFVVGMPLDASVSIERSLCTQLKPIGCDMGKDVLPPVRQYSPEEVGAVLQDRHIDSVLIITLAADHAVTSYLGTLATGQASTFGNRTYTNASSVPMYGVTRQALGSFSLFDRESGKAAWVGQIKVSGQGAVNTTDYAFIASATSKLAREIKASGFFP